MLRVLHDTKIDFIKHWRTAVILTIAFVIAGVVGMLQISPTPFAPYGPSTVGCSTIIDVISGVSIMPGMR